MRTSPSTAGSSVTAKIDPGGMTEAVGSVCFPQLEQKICTPGSAGRLVPGITARVVKPDGKMGGFNELGQLVIRSDAVALGYLNNEEA